MPNVLQCINYSFPLGVREEVIVLSINNKKLSGSLTLTGFSNLTNFYCSDNQLTELDLSSCSNLTKLDCSRNQLTNLNVSNCLGLIYLACDNNQLTDLTIFSKLVNCQVLILDNNPWTGSLTTLQYLPCLTRLDIEDTELMKGLEYLPESLERIYCTGSLAEKLADYKGRYNHGYSYQTWKNDYFHLIISNKILWWESVLNDIICKQKKKSFEEKVLDDDNIGGFRFWVAVKIIIIKLKVQIHEYYLKKIRKLVQNFSSNEELLKKLFFAEVELQKTLSGEQRIKLQEESEKTYGRLKNNLGEKNRKKIGVVLEYCKELGEELGKIKNQLEKEFGLTTDLEKDLKEGENNIFYYQTLIELPQKNSLF